MCFVIFRNLPKIADIIHGFLPAKDKQKLAFGTFFFFCFFFHEAIFIGDFSSSYIPKNWKKNSRSQKKMKPKKQTSNFSFSSRSFLCEGTRTQQFLVFRSNFHTTLYVISSTLEKLRALVALNENLKEQEKEFKLQCKVSDLQVKTKFQSHLYSLLYAERVLFKLWNHI